MTENFEHTQPTQVENTQPTQPEAAETWRIRRDDTQPLKPVKKPSRWISFLIGLFGFILLVGLGGYGGYAAGINDRVQAEKEVVSRQLMEQYQLALVDIQFGRYATARQRLEYIISKDASFPGVAEKLTEIMVMSSIPTATLTPTITPTPDHSGVESAYQRAQQLINAQDWQNALAALDIVRKLDRNYKTAQVDGMYYYALRNFGNDLIKNGNLEGGIYQLSLAERFGPLDSASTQARDAARMYIIGASFWELDWKQVILYFSQIGSGMWDGSMTAGERLNTAYVRYGNELFDNGDYCGAYEQYSRATSLPENAASRSQKAQMECYPPEPVATEAPVVPTP